MNHITAFFKTFHFRARILALLALALSSWLLVISCSISNAGQSAGSMSPDKIADYIHRIIKSERTVYGKYVVQRLAEENVLHASENWQQDKALPLPAQMFRMSAEQASENSAFSYGSISPWSLNDGNAPKTDFEKKAMQTVLENGLPFKGTQTIEGKKYFSALYPDKAVSSTCVNCHNQHPVHRQRYPDKVFKVGDVMGGILINLPFNEE